MRAQVELEVKESPAKYRTKSGVWEHMFRVMDGTMAQCMVGDCLAVVKTPNSGTSSCRRHLKSVHNIEVSFLKFHTFLYPILGFSSASQGPMILHQIPSL